MFTTGGLGEGKRVIKAYWEEMSGKIESKLLVGKQAHGHWLFWPSPVCSQLILSYLLINSTYNHLFF